LYDTYGFPIDLTVEILDEAKLTADLDGFDALMQKQRELARASRGSQDEAGWDEDAFADLPDTEFVGYDPLICSNLETQATVLAVSGNDIVLDKSPFYAESGGQVGDKGEIYCEGGYAEVIDTQKRNGRYIHRVDIQRGEFVVGESIGAKIDIEYRKDIIRNHSAAHLLQSALREVLGDHVTQAGSLVDANRMRFDFTHIEAMTEDEVAQVERIMNEKILANLPVETIITTPEEATKMGATALFGEKYGESVRVVKIGDYSTELCGGCHVKNTGEIGLFKLTSESGVAAGVRRIEGVTGYGVINELNRHENTVAELAKTLKTQPKDVVEKAATLTEELKIAKNELGQIKSKMAAASSGDLASKAETVGKVNLISTRAEDGLDMNSLRTMGDNLKQSVPNALIVLVSRADGKVNIVAMATKDAVEKGINCGTLVKEIVTIMGGGGGGRPDNAQGSWTDDGAPDAAKIMEALSKIKEMIANV